MRRFADAEVIPHAQDWHRSNSYIPLEVIQGLAEMGVFGLTIPEEHGGLGLGKVAMCVVSEELVARLYRRRLARHPLGDRRRADPGRRHAGAEGATICRRSPAAKSCRPPCSPSPTPAPTSLRCARARSREGDVYKVTGNKTWITHAVRADLMTLLVAHQSGREGLQGPFDAAGREAARHRRRPVPGDGHDGRRDRGARLSRHEGIRDRLRRLRGARPRNCSAASRARASSS